MGHHVGIAGTAKYPKGWLARLFSHADVLADGAPIPALFSREQGDQGAASRGKRSDHDTNKLPRCEDISLKQGIGPLQDDDWLQKVTEVNLHKQPRDSATSSSPALMIANSSSHGAPANLAIVRFAAIVSLTTMPMGSKRQERFTPAGRPSTCFTSHKPGRKTMLLRQPDERN